MNMDLPAFYKTSAAVPVCVPKAESRWLEGCALRVLTAKQKNTQNLSLNYTTLVLTRFVVVVKYIFSILK